MDSPYLGRIVNGRYLIEKELGRGGIGVVYLAKDKQLLSKPVVIKVLLDQSIRNEWIRRKFHQEIEALSRIDHPGVVGVIDAGEMPDGEPYFVMQFVEGVTLRSLIQKEAMKLAEIAELTRQIGRALSAAHDKKVYHRDLKPENVMVQTLGEGELQVKVIDFGIARVDQSLLFEDTTSPVIAGTIAYMAPEQLMGEPVSALSDVYSLSVIAYEMISGRRPFAVDSIYQLLEMQRSGTVAPLAHIRSDLPPTAQEIILSALSFDSAKRPQRARDFGDSLAESLTGVRGAGAGKKASEAFSNQVLTYTPTSVNQRAVSASADPLNVVLLYKRNAEKDERLVKILEKELSSCGHRVFIDRHMSVGVEWAKEIERRLREADAVIALISAASASSEMLCFEIQIARDEARKRSGKPRLLPVRVDYLDRLPDSLDVVLSPINYAMWAGPEDDRKLIEELVVALRESAVHSPTVPLKRLEPAGGAVPLDSKFYIVRPADEEFHAAIARRDSIVLVKGARQMGKTSLLARGLQQARESGAKVVLTDLQKLTEAHLESSTEFFLAIAQMFADQLDLDVLPEETWNPRRSANVNFERYMRREALAKTAAPIAWGLDEVDRLFSSGFGNEVFGLFRSWHNERSLDPTGPWGRLTMAIAYATEAHLFITDLNQSPFNVGTRLTLDDFTFEQVEELNHRHGSPLKNREAATRYFQLVGGQPYLVRRGLYEMAARGISIEEFEAQADRDEGPFGDHLRRMLVLLVQDQTLCDAVRFILQGKSCPNAESFYRLRSAGVMSGDMFRNAQPRCRLYANYLERHIL